MKIADEKRLLMVRFYREGFSCHSIAKALGVSVGAVFNHLKKNGELRSRREMFTYSVWSLTPEQKGRTAMMGKAPRSDETRKKLSESKKMHTSGHKKIRSDGYVAVYYPDHPDSNRRGYIMEHRLVFEEHLGRRIRPDEVVHHVNKNRSDNRIENLKLMTVHDHMSYHMKERHKERRAI